MCIRDSPWSTVSAEYALLRQAGLSEAELEMICHGNAERFFGITLSA